MESKLDLDSYVQQSLASLRRREEAVSFPSNSEYSAFLTSEHYRDYFHELNRKEIHINEITLPAATDDLYTTLLELYEEGIPIPCKTLNIAINNELIANQKLINLIKQIANSHLIDINLIADTEEISEKNIGLLTTSLLNASQDESLYINVTLPTAWQNSLYQMQIDDQMQDKLQVQSFMPKAPVEIRRRVSTQAKSRPTRRLPTSGQSVQSDYEEEQEQEHEEEQEQEHELEVDVDREQEFLVDADQKGTNKNDNKQFIVFKNIDDSELTKVNTAENRLFTTGTNYEQIQESFLKLINKEGSKGARRNAIWISHAAYIELLKYNEQFSQGLDFHRLPAGFEIETSRTHFQVKFNEQAKQLAKYDPLAVQAHEPIPTTRIPNSIFQEQISTLPENSPIRIAWGKITTPGESLQNYGYSREAYQTFRNHLPKLTELSHESQEFLFAACLQDGEFNFKLVKFLLENAQYLPTDVDSFDELYMKYPLLLTIFKELAPQHLGNNRTHEPDELNSVVSYLKSYKNKPPIPLEDSFIYKSSIESNRELLRQLYTAFPDINLNALLPLVIPEGNNQLAQLVEVYNSYPEVFTQLYNDIYKKNGRFQELLSETLQRDITALQGLDGGDKLLWDAIYPRHIAAQPDSNIHDLISALKVFKGEMAKLKLPIEGPFNFKNVTNLPNTLSNILTVLRHTPKVNQASVWQSLKSMDLSNAGVIQTQAVYVEGENGTTNDSQLKWEFVCEEMLLDAEHTTWNGFYSAPRDYFDLKHTINNSSAEEGKSQTFRYIAIRGKNAQLPLDFYKSLQTKLTRTWLSSQNQVKLFAILAASTSGRVNASAAQQDMQRTKVYSQEIIELVQAANLLGAAGIIIDSINKLPEIPPIDALRHLACFIANNARSNREQITQVHNNLIALVGIFDNAIYAGMKDYSDDDYNNNQLFQNFLNTAARISNIRQELDEDLKPYYHLIEVENLLQNVANPEDDDTPSSNKIEEIIQKLKAVEEKICDLKENFPSQYDDRNMPSVQEAIDSLDTENPDIEKVIELVQKKIQNATQEHAELRDQYVVFTKNLVKLISTFALNLTADEISQIKGLLTTNIKQVNEVLITLSNISRANNKDYQLTYSDLYKIIEGVATKTPEELAEFSANDYLEEFTLVNHTPLSSLFPEEYFAQRKQDPISQKILDAIKDLGEDEQEYIKNILRNFNKPNDRDSYQAVVDSLLAVKATVEPHQFKKLLKLINQNPDLFLNESELSEHSFLKLIASLNTKRQVQCLTIFISRAQQLQKADPDRAPDFELADKALVFTRDLLSDVSSIENMGLKQKEYIPMLVNTVLNARTTDLKPSTPSELNTGRFSPASNTSSDNLSEISIVDSPRSGTSTELTQSSSQSMLSNQVSSIYGQLNDLVQRYPSAHTTLVDLYQSYVAQFASSGQTSIVEYLDLFVNRLEEAFTNLDEDEVLALCAQFNTKKLHPNNLQELLTYLHDYPPEQQASLLKIAIAIINDDRGYELSSFRELCKNYGQFAIAIDQIYARAPIPRIDKVLSWINKSKENAIPEENTITEEYEKYCLNPCERDPSCGFDVEKAKSQWQLFTGVPDSCEMIDFEAFRDITLTMCELSINDLLQVFDKENQSDEFLVAAAAELRHRCKGQDIKRADGSLKPGCSEELNTTQYLAALVALKSGKIVAEQMLTGQGKTRTTAVIDACKQKKGYTVDKLTSEMALARRDYLMAKSFYKLLGINSTIISSNSSSNQYIKRGINFSDIYNMNSFRNNARSNGEGHLVIADNLNERYASIDESDKIFDMAFMRINISMQADEAIQNMPWVYPLMLNYFADFPGAREAYTNPDLSVEKFLGYAATHPDISDQQYARLQDINSEVIEVWQESALIAETLDIGKVFDIREDDLAFTSTGIQEINQAVMLVAGSESPKSKFSKGVYQFLQARLQLIRDGKLQTESAALSEALRNISSTNFDIPEEKTIVYSSSMIDMIFDYDSILFMSGTTGHALERLEAEMLYADEESPMVHIDVPPHQALQRTDEITATDDDDAHLEQIMQEILDAQERGQPILIFTSDNIENDRIIKAIRQRFPDQQNVQDVTSRTNLNDEDVVDNIFANAAKPGFITVATERAGRGFDFYVNENATRGLHTCVSFLPKTQRDYEQMVGRSGRMGRPGSSKLILNKKTIPKYIYRTPPNLEAGLKKHFNIVARTSQVDRLLVNTFLLFHRKIRHSLYSDLLTPEVIENLSTEQHSKIKKTYGTWLAKAYNIWSNYLPEINEHLKVKPLTTKQIESINLIMEKYQNEIQTIWDLTYADLSSQLTEIDETLVDSLIKDLPSLEFHPKVIQRLLNKDGANVDEDSERTQSKFSKYGVPILYGLGATVAGLVLGFFGYVTLPAIIIGGLTATLLSALAQNKQPAPKEPSIVTEETEEIPSLRSEHSYKNIVDKLQEQESHHKKPKVENNNNVNIEREVEEENVSTNLSAKTSHSIPQDVIEKFISGKEPSHQNTPQSTN